jgi:glucans biosynthesis protein
MWALLDSPAESGACQFTITPGKPLAIDVETEVWFRHHVQKVGIAPLTSMWMWDASNPHANDPRPEVHDSDGLSIHSKNGEWTWRPLDRPKKPRVDRLQVENLAGFGLLQRDRDPEHYRDAEAKYHDRPSAWVAPTGDWGRGHVELLELPAENEGVDNIGAYWVPDQRIDTGSHLAFSYRLTFGERLNDGPFRWIVTDSRTKSAANTYKFEVEFMNEGKPGPIVAEPIVSCDEGSLENVTSERLGSQHLLVRFTYRPADADTAHIQAQLATGKKPVSEKWSYQWTRN